MAVALWPRSKSAGELTGFGDDRALGRRPGVFFRDRFRMRWARSVDAHNREHRVRGRCRRPRGSSSRIPNSQPTFHANITVAGGPAPVRAYMRELMRDVLEGRIEPGLVFDRTTNIDSVPDGYRAMNEREATKVIIAF